MDLPRRGTALWSLVACIVVAAFIPSRVSAQQKDYALVGAQVLDVDYFAVHIQAGYPDISVDLHIPVLEELEITPRVTFSYAPAFAGFAFDPGIYGNRFGADIKLHIYSTGKLHLSLLWQPALFFNYNTEIEVGRQLVVNRPGQSGFVPVYADPLEVGMVIALPGGVVLDYQVSPRIILTAGFHLPIIVTFEPVGAFILPINLSAGLEYGLRSDMKLTFLVEGGPVVIDRKDEDAFVGPNLRAMVGWSYAF